jgi:hypothetical protein
MLVSPERCSREVRFVLTGLALVVLTLSSPVFAASSHVESQASAQNEHAASSGTRFTVLNEFNGQAVRDNTTGLVWNSRRAWECMTGIGRTGNAHPALSAAEQAGVCRRSMN